MRQFANSDEETDVSTLHSEHRPITNAATQAGSAEERPRVWIGTASTIPVVPDDGTLPVSQHMQFLQFIGNRITEGTT